jgi:hypothetical protein
VAKLLAAFKIKPKQVGVHDKHPNGNEVAWFEKAIEKYLPQEGK